MGKQKLKRFAEIATFDNVVEPEMAYILTQDHELKGNWNSHFFKNDNPIVLELGCGKGEYTVGLAAHFENKNFIGIDIKGNRIWRGAKTAIENNISNAAFLRTRIEFINRFFAENEVSEIWITFPDPQPTDRREKKRLPGLLLLKNYIQFLQPNAIVHLKTDNYPLFEYSHELWKSLGFEIIHATADLYRESISNFNPEEQKILGIKTYYEEKFSAKGFTICYLKGRLLAETRINIQQAKPNKKAEPDQTEEL